MTSKEQLMAICVVCVLGIVLFGWGPLNTLIGIFLGYAIKAYLDE